MVVGASVIAIGLAANEWVVGAVLGIGTPFDRGSRLTILGFQTACLAVGILLIVVRRTICNWVGIRPRHQRRDSGIRIPPRLLAVALGCAVACILLVGLERVSQAIVAARPGNDFSGGYTQGFFRFDEALGYVPRPACRVDSVLTKNGSRVYSVEYTIDARSHRVTPRPVNAPRSTALVFFGGSYTFGEGVDDHETFPAHVADLAPGHVAYNYGFSGYGPQQMLEQVVDETFDDSIVEDSGHGVYLFIDDHIGRAVGAMSVSSGWGRNFPHYVLEGNRLVRRGSFGDGRHGLTSVYAWLSRRAIVQAFSVDLPLVYRSDHIRLTARLIAAAAASFRGTFPDSTFYTVVFPGSEYGDEIGRLLADERVRLLDYSRLFDPDDPKLVREVDRHPTGDGYARLAEAFVRDANLAGP